MHCSKRGEHCAIIKALRFAKASTIGPFDNTSIASAGLADYLVRKNPPNTLAILGAYIVIMSGLYMMESDYLYQSARQKI